VAFEQKEFRLHAAAVRYLRTVCPECIVFHAANGEYRRPETVRRLKAQGVLPGIFDLILIDPEGKHYYLEAKSATGRLTEAQQWFKKELILRCIPYVVFRSLDDVKEFVLQNRIPNRIADAA
jgi:hypothetical protein